MSLSSSSSEEEKEDREMIDEGLIKAREVGVTEGKDEGSKGKIEVTEGMDDESKGEIRVIKLKDEGSKGEFNGEEGEEETKLDGFGDISSTHSGKRGPIKSLFSEIEIMVADQFITFGKSFGDINQCRDIVLYRPLTLTPSFVEKREQWTKRKEETIPSSIVRNVTGLMDRQKKKKDSDFTTPRTTPK